MHGVIFSELKKYTITKLGEGEWPNIIKEAGLETKMYIPQKSYPDTEAIAIVSACSKLTKIPINNILDDFGEFIFPDLFKMYQGLIEPKWKTIDFLNNIEETIHKIVRIRESEAKPPSLKCEKISNSEIIVKYDSPRKLCYLLKGMVKGVAKHYNERVSVIEQNCMQNGHAHCNVLVKLI
jgi:hypothetical protein